MTQRQRRSRPPLESTPKAKRNVPANYTHSVLLLLKNDSEAVLFLCHFSDCLALIFFPIDSAYGINEISANIDSEATK